MQFLSKLGVTAYVFYTASDRDRARAVYDTILNNEKLEEYLRDHAIPFMIDVGFGA